MNKKRRQRYINLSYNKPPTEKDLSRNSPQRIKESLHKQKAVNGFCRNDFLKPTFFSENEAFTLLYTRGRVVLLFF